MATTHEFNNDTDQHTRREVLRNDTLFSRQQHTPDDAGGRYAKLTPATITGSTPSPQYPKQPANSFWSHDPVAATPPLGFSVDAMEPVGTPAEIEASLPTLNSPVVRAPPAAVEDRGVGEPVVSVVSSPLSAQATGSRSIKRRSW